MPNRLASCLAAMIFGGAAVLAAQAPAAVDASRRVHDLLVLVESADHAAALEAATELERIGPSVAPALVETLKTSPGCQAQWVASGVLARLKLEAALVETTRLQMARGTCQPLSVADVRLQQDAAFAVIDRVRGISLMAELLRGDDQMARYRAAFAFDALTERLRSDHAQTIAATPEIVAATEAALPLLRGVAVSRANAQLRCLCYEALDQARRLPIDPLRTRATKLLDGVRIDCDPAPGGAAPGGPAAGTAGSSVSTGTMKRETLEQLIAQLDSQSGELAARTSNALLAAGDQVEPLLQTRLGQTDKCRGLALVAGILASRNAAAADVDVAFTRVLEGKCDGREPFDLQLAQGVAAAFVTR
ncbi:MAG TPA: hypothetical protein VN759_04220, partial [Pseudolysinimonas sp.]|nr:hypothetical protein [Pseudolysinimonas sp.]